ncbi:MAG: hypothetical protein OXI54_11915 [Chloroflexota bacterium]|nr:hypothetical protein [Chloroflexota bacterium]MDE2684837.1 hypothetical protein [Chloroflexota bacterium]
MPRLVASVTLSSERLELGPQLPVSIPGFDYTPPALIDTGAAMSLIDVDLARRFYPPTSEALVIGGVGQGGEHPTFDIDAQIPDLIRYVPKPIASAPLIRSGIPFIFIIGRDVLLDYILTIDGPSRTISFHQH